jgi:hypothetical protein
MIRGKRRKTRFTHGMRTVVLLLLLLAAGLAALSFVALRKLGWQELRVYAQRDLPAGRPLDDIPANTWVKLHQPWAADWRRQGHAGAAYDSRRGRLMIFGSDTHGTNWDNRVHIFDPDHRLWESPYLESPPDSYAADRQGRAVAGEDGSRPWAMHTYDTVVYDAGQDALVAAARPEHNPMRRKVSEARDHPAWRYDIASGAWQPLDNGGQPTPSFFATSAAYDPHRDTLVVYAKGIWEMGPARDVWRKTSGERHHEIHHSLEYDARRRLFAVFGDYRNSNAVWLYRPGWRPGQAGVWEERRPGGEAPPPSQSFPVAYDADHGLFLLVVDDAKGAAGRRARSYVYDVDANRYARLPHADMPALGMNYNLVYDSRRKVFLLVTGGWQTPPVVWVLRLNPDLLPGAHAR